MLLGGIEAGGTKFVCAVADGAGRIRAQARIATRAPAETLSEVRRFFRESSATHGTVAAIGIGSFGPLSLDPDAADYGSIISTPKPGWAGTNLLAALAELGVPLALDTDVNAAAIAEMLFGSARGLADLAYITVGTGIGVGIIAGGTVLRGMSHAEAGHVRLPRAPGDGHFAGVCLFHGDCAEGLASGPALAARWGMAADQLAPDHPGWAIEADYLASLCATLTYVLRPRRIVLGGGVMAQPQLLPMVRAALPAKLGGYDSIAAALDMDTYLAPPGAGAAAGLTGALALAYRAATGDWPAATFA